MSHIKLIADSGSTKTEWCVLVGKKKKVFTTQGMSPYFISGKQMEVILKNELLPELKNTKVNEIYYYGTGCSNPANVQLVKKAIKNIFSDALIKVDHDLMGAAKALCGDEKGIACILGTGSNSCYYNGKKIVKNTPASVIF